MALPDPSKIRPSMSSDTPSFRLWPVNSTFVYIPSAHLSLSFSPCMPYLLNINARRAFEHLIAISVYHNQPAQEPYLHNSPITYPDSSAYTQLTHCSGHLPLASKTCPDLSVPSGSVKVTISLYLGNLTYPLISTHSQSPHPLPYSSLPL
jgi:hypothetical protein